MFADLSDLLLGSDENFLRHCVIEPFQASGAGGQKRNRVYSGQRLRIKKLPQLFAQDCSARESAQNLQRALFQLKLECVWALVSEKIWTENAVLLQSNRISLSHPLYPLWLWSILSLLHEHQFALSALKEATGLSTSALIRQIARDKRFWSYVQQRREALGLKALKAS